MVGVLEAAFCLGLVDMDGRTLGLVLEVSLGRGTQAGRGGETGFSQGSMYVRAQHVQENCG